MGVGSSDLEAFSERGLRGSSERYVMFGGVGAGISEKHVFYCLLPVVNAPSTAASQAIMLALSGAPHISSQFC